MHNSTVEKTANGTLSRGTRKRSLKNFLCDGENHKEPAKRPHCSESLSSRVTDWLSQLPPEDPDATNTAPEEPGLSSPAPLPGSVATSLLSRSYTETIDPSSESSEGRTRIPAYRNSNLKPNRIFHLDHDESIPKRIALVCDSITGRCTWPEPTPKEAGVQMRSLRRLQDRGANPPAVRSWFDRHLSSQWDLPDDWGLKASSGDTFKRECVPGPLAGACKVRRPRPDFTYGYDTYAAHTAFSETQRNALSNMRPKWGLVDTLAHISLPFLVVEVCAEGPDGETLWNATNRCMGSSASCVKVVKRLNDFLRRYPDAPQVNEATFGLVLNQVVARLYVAWSEPDDSLLANRDGLQYNMKRVDRFDLEEMEGLLRLRRCIGNIIDWGRGSRLWEIQEALDFVHEEDQKTMAAPESCTRG